MTTKQWMPVADDEYPMVRNAEEDDDFLYIFGNTGQDTDVCTWVERYNETIMLDVGMRICRLTAVDKPVSVPLEVRETINAALRGALREALGLHLQQRRVDETITRLDAALAWLDGLEASDAS